MDNKNTFGYKLGQILGGVVLGSVALCIASVVVALTLKFMAWIF
jgi:hypothetical protein